MKTSKSAALSRREKLVVRSEADIRRYANSAEAKRVGKRLKAPGLDPSEADLKAVPQLTSEELNRMYRVRKSPVTVRLDADVLAWLKAKPGKYQQHLNAALRTEMIRERKAAR